MQCNRQPAQIDLLVVRHRHQKVALSLFVPKKKVLRGGAAMGWYQFSRLFHRSNRRVVEPLVANVVLCENGVDVSHDLISLRLPTKNEAPGETPGSTTRVR